MEYMGTTKSIPKSGEGLYEYMKYMKWDIYNYDVGNKVWSLRQNLGVSYGGGVPRDVLEGGALSASLISRHHLNASCCRAGAGYLKHKEAASWPLFWGQLIISPHLSSYSLFSLVVQMLSKSNFVTLFHFHFGSKVSWILFTFHVRKDVEKERITMSLPVAFHFGHNHCRSISHNHSDHHRVRLSQSMSTTKLTLLEQDI